MKKIEVWGNNSPYTNKKRYNITIGNNIIPFSERDYVYASNVFQSLVDSSYKKILVSDGILRCENKKYRLGISSSLEAIFREEGNQVIVPIVLSEIDKAKINPLLRKIGEEITSSLIFVWGWEKIKTEEV